MKDALRQTRIYGIETNQSYLESVLENETGDSAARSPPSCSRRSNIRPATLDILEPGTQTSVQDYPGRLGYWAVGVPPSGPMDALAFRFGNRLLGNAPDGCWIGNHNFWSDAPIQYRLRLLSDRRRDEGRPRRQRDRFLDGRSSTGGTNT